VVIPVVSSFVKGVVVESAVRLIEPPDPLKAEPSTDAEAAGQVPVDVFTPTRVVAVVPAMAV